jgi:integrase
MATITKIGTRFRAVVRKGGQQHCKTMASKALVKRWAETVEREIEELKADGYMQPGDLTVSEMITRYEREVYKLKPWSVSKRNDLGVLKEAFADMPVSDLTHAAIIGEFKKMSEGGTGGVGIGARIGYLIDVLSTAKDFWRLSVPVSVAEDARRALTKVGMITASKERNRRVTDAEIERILKHIETMDTRLPMRDIIYFCVATTMRISEVTRITWADLNEADRTVVIRDRKHPRKKIGNDSTVPLLTVAGHDAFAIATRQPRTHKCIFPVNCRTVGTYFINAAMFLQIPDLHLHDLRHEGISRLFEAGYLIQEVSIVSGHKDWGMLRRYTHIKPVDLHTSVAARKGVGQQ